MDSRERWRQGAAWYLMIQAFAVFAWWIWLSMDSEAYSAFVGPLLPDRFLRSYLLPDLVLYGGGGFLAAFLIHGDRPWIWPFLLVLTGGILYATLATAALAYGSGGGWIGIPLMVASFAGTAFFTWRLRPS